MYLDTDMDTFEFIRNIYLNTDLVGYSKAEVTFNYQLFLTTTTLLFLLLKSVFALNVSETHDFS